MRHLDWLKFLVLSLVISFFAVASFAQNAPTKPVDISVVSEEDITPSVIQALPDWEKVKDNATHIKNAAELKKAFTNQKVLDLIGFAGGTEGATADYPAGKLLIIEFQTPQFSVDADNKIQQFLSANPSTPPIYYRRIGNYSVFVFDGKDEAATNALLDRVKYDKVVQWLGEDPNYLKRAEDYFIKQASQLFVSTMVAIVGGIGVAIVLGIVAGFLFFRWRNQKLNRMAAFSDAGGMVRLNLDELTEDISTNKLLRE